MSLSDAIRKRINDLSDEYKIPIPRWSIVAGINPTTMYAAMKESAGCPKVATLKLLCEAIGITLSDFFNVDFINESDNEDDIISIRKR